MKFGFRYDSIVENGASVTPDVAFTRATSGKITVSSAGLVKYYVNDVLKHTSTITAGWRIIFVYLLPIIKMQI